MSLRLFLLMSCVAWSAPAVALAQQEADFTPAPLPNCSTICLRDYARENLRVEPTGYEAARSLIVNQTTMSNAEQKLEDVAAKFKAEERKLSNGASSLEMTKRTGEFAFSLADDFLPLKDLLPTSTLSAMVSAGFDLQIAAVEKRKNALAGDILGPVLAEIRTANAAQINALANKSPTEIHAAIFGKDGNVGLIGSSDIYNNLNAEGKSDLVNLKVDVLKSQLVAVSNGLVFTQGQIDALVGDYTKFKGDITTFAEKASSQINTLTEGQKALARAYVTLDGEVRSNSYRLDALEGIMWSRMSAKEKVTALKGGAFSSVISGMPEQKRKQYLEDLDKAAVLQNIRDGAQMAGQVANDFAAIGGFLGVDLKGPANEVNRAAEIATNVLAIYSGGPIGVISGLGGLSRMFGGGSGDGTGAALAALRRDIQQMRKEMYEYHVAEMKALESLSSQIDDRFRQVAGLQGSTLDQIGFNTLQLTELLKANLDSCISLSREWRYLAGEGFDDRASRFNISSQYLAQKCRDGIQDRLLRPQSDWDPVVVSTIFSMESLSTDGLPEDRANQVIAIMRYRDETLRPTVIYTLREHGLGVDATNCRKDDLLFMTALAAPSRDGDLRAEGARLVEACKKGRPIQYLVSDGARLDLSLVLTAPLSANAILHYGRAVHDVAPVWETIRQPGSASSPEAMDLAMLKASTQAQSNNRADFAVRQLQKALDLVNLSVAQINLLGGDIVLERLALDVEAGLDDPGMRDLSAKAVDQSKWSKCDAAGTKSSRYFNALCMLQRNDALRFNFTRHWVRTRLVNPATTPHLRYAIGMQRAEPIELAASFRRTMPLERCGSTWCVRLPGADIPDPDRSPMDRTGATDDRFDLKGSILLTLPPWYEVATDRQAVASEELDKLLGLRKDLVVRISEMRAARQLTADERQLAYAALVLAAVEREGEAPATTPPAPLKAPELVSR